MVVYGLEALMTPTPIDEYLAGISDPAAQKTLTTLRGQLRKLLPTATETISYGMPAFRMESGKVAAGFAFFGKNCGYYPHSGNIVPALKKLLASFKTSTGAVSFPPDRPLPAPVVKALVNARLKEIAGAKKAVPRPRPKAARTVRKARAKRVGKA
jgi:uncharacterized protein YdhG (YjbR/CyaY superfamily)